MEIKPIFIPPIHILSSMCNNIKEDCPCKNDKCPRHGNCRECVEFHVSKKNKPPFCLRDIEWTEY